MMGDESFSASRPIRVFVRKGAHDLERRVSFHWTGFDGLGLLNDGFSLDGNQAVLVVTGTDEASLFSALRSVELKVLSLIKGAGRDFEFG